MVSIQEKSVWDKLFQTIAQDRKLLWTVAVYVDVFLVFINISIANSFGLGLALSSVFFLVNSVFLGDTFFRGEELFLKFSLGGVVLVTMIGLLGWGILIVLSLDATGVTILLSVIGALSSIANKVSRYTFAVEFVRDPGA